MFVETRDEGPKIKVPNLGDKQGTLSDIVFALKIRIEANKEILCIVVQKDVKKIEEETLLNIACLEIPKDYNLAEAVFHLK
jgi:hypothetical protein